MDHQNSTTATIPSASGPFSFPVILPEQLADGRRREPTPEQRLMIAILEDAICCFEKYDGARSTTGRRLFHDAEWWIMADPDCRPFSFEHVCFVLGLDASAVRRTLLRRLDRKRAVLGRPALQGMPSSTPIIP